ncbi:multidrug effflux MFS transporter [Marinobacter hydrocarbonoclasticus]|nr:multidrug effflux MFS transporter [Marinobacter nauticus]
MKRDHLGVVMTILLLIFPQISETLYAPVLPSLAGQFAVGEAQAQLTMSLYFIGFALGVVFWGVLCDCIGRRQAMLLGLSAYLSGALLALWASHYPTFLLARVVLAFGASAGSVVTQTMIRDRFSGAELARLFSLVGAALSFSPALGPLIGGLAAEYGGVAGVLLVMLAMAIGLLGLSLLRLPETRTEPQTPVALWPVARKMVRDPKLWRSALLIALMNLLIFGWYSQGPFVVAALGYSPKVFGMTGWALALGSAIGAMANRRLLSRCTPQQLIRCGAMLALAASLIQLAVALFWLTANLTGLVLLLLPMIGVVVGFGLVVPNVLSGALKEYQQALGVAGAWFGLAYYLLIALGLWLVSGTVELALWGMPLSFVLFSALACVAARCRNTH